MFRNFGFPAWRVRGHAYVSILPVFMIFVLTFELFRNCSMFLLCFGGVFCFDFFFHVLFFVFCLFVCLFVFYCCLFCFSFCGLSSIFILRIHCDEGYHRNASCALSLLCTFHEIYLYWEVIAKQILLHIISSKLTRYETIRK